MNNSDRTEELLTMPAIEIDTEGALARFGARAREVRRVRRSGQALRLLRRAPVGPVRWLAAAAGVVIVATTLTMTGVADSIFQIFETKQFAAVSVTTTDLQTLGQLSAFGTLTWTDQAQPHRTATLAQASLETGLPAFTVTLPRSITGAPTYGAMAKRTGTFVFDAAKAGATAAAVGRTAPPMPAKLDGSTLILSGGPAIVVTYGVDASGDRSGSSLFIATAKAPTVASDGASVGEIQAYLLSQPSISPALAAQIRAIGDPATTLPIPIPAGQASAVSVTVHGTTGLFIGDSTGLGSGVLWQQGGIVYAVGGTLTQAETLAVANSLR